MRKEELVKKSELIKHIKKDGDCDDDCIICEIEDEVFMKGDMNG